MTAEALANQSLDSVADNGLRNIALCYRKAEAGVSESIGQPHEHQLGSCDTPAGSEYPFEFAGLS